MPAEKPWKEGNGEAPGACGELVHGITTLGQRFHISCPIDLFSQVRLYAREYDGDRHTAGGKNLQPKMRAGILETLRYKVNQPAEVILARHISDLQTSKGMAASTADIVAAQRAICEALGFRMSRNEEAGLAARVEPTDGIMFSQIVALEQTTGQLLRLYPWQPKFHIVMVIPQAPMISRPDENELIKDAQRYDEILRELDGAVDAQDIEKFARTATLSADLAQRWHTVPLWKLMRSSLDDFGALGLCIAHSGTVSGLLFSERERAQEIHDYISQKLPSHIGRTLLVQTPEPREPGDI